MATIRCKHQTFENIQAVLFDKDGTLANVETYLKQLGEMRSRLIAGQVPGLQAALLSAFGLQYGQIDAAGLLAVGSREQNEVAAAAYVAATGIGWVAALNLVTSAFEQAEAALPRKVTQTPLLPGAAQLILQLKSAGATLGIVSSDTHLEVAAFTQYYALSEISWYCGVSSSALPKTHPDFLQFACEALAVPLTGVLVVGDSAADAALACQGAAGFVGLTGGWQRSPRFSPDIVSVETLSQVEVFH
ncbi:MAG: HAD family hydrolase [Phormidesmis sp.]